MFDQLTDNLDSQKTYVKDLMPGDVIYIIDVMWMVFSVAKLRGSSANAIRCLAFGSGGPHKGMLTSFDAPDDWHCQRFSAFNRGRSGAR